MKYADIHVQVVNGITLEVKWRQSNIKLDGCYSVILHNYVADYQADYQAQCQQHCTFTYSFSGQCRCIMAAEVAQALTTATAQRTPIQNA